MAKAVFFLSELQASDVKWLIENGQRLDLPLGSVLIKQNAPIRALYFLIKGELAVSVSSPGDVLGREVARLKVGEVVGELSFLDRRPPSANVSAASDVVLLALARSDLEAKLQSDASFAANFYRAVGVSLSSRLRKAVAHLGFADEEQVEDAAHSKEQEDSISLARDWFVYIQNLMEREKSSH